MAKHKAKHVFDYLSFSDYLQLAGAVAIERSLGPSYLIYNSFAYLLMIYYLVGEGKTLVQKKKICIRIYMKILGAIVNLK